MPAFSAVSALAAGLRITSAAVIPQISDRAIRSSRSQALILGSCSVSACP